MESRYEVPSQLAWLLFSKELDTSDTSVATIVVSSAPRKTPIHMAPRTQFLARLESFVGSLRWSSSLLGGETDSARRRAVRSLGGGDNVLDIEAVMALSLVRVEGGAGRRGRGEAQARFADGAGR